MVRTEDFNFSHLDKMELKNKNMDIENFKKIIGLSCHAKTVFIDDLPIFALGLSRLAEGVMEVWFLNTIHAHKYAKTLFKTTKLFMESYVTGLNIRRLQATAFLKDCEFLEKLGFEKECELKGFFENENFFMYRRLF